MQAAPRHRTFPRFFAGLSRDTFLLALASLFSDISTEMLYPVLPVFLTQTLKASGSVLGLVDGIAQAAQNIVQGFSGALSDRLRRRKPIALCGYLLAALAKPLTGLAASWQGVLGARLLDRLGRGTHSLQLQSRQNTAVAHSASRAWATMPELSWDHCWRCCCFLRQALACARSSIWQ